MIANWAFAPVCGFDFWRVIVTSPEVLIFLFFMITDPKTVPAGRVGRVVVRLPRRGGEHAPDGAADQRVRHEGRPARRARRRVRGPPAPRPAAARAAVRGRRHRPVRDAARDRRRRRAPASPARRVRVGLIASSRSSRSGSASSPPGRRPAASSSPDTAEVLNRVPAPGRSGHASRRSPSSRTSPTANHEIAGAGAAGDRPDARREPRAREPGAAPTATRRS